MVAYPSGTQALVGPEDSVNLSLSRRADANLIRYLSNLQPQAFDSIAHRFAARLEVLGYPVSVLPRPVDWLLYAAVRSGGSGASASLRQLHASVGSDRLILLAVDRLGTLRDYFLFAPHAAPLGMFQVSGLLLDLEGERVLWKAEMLERQNLVMVEGPWQQPPLYPNVTRAMRQAEARAVEWLGDAFFQSEGPVDSPP